MVLQWKTSLSVITIIAICGVPAWSLAQTLTPASSANGTAKSTGQSQSDSQAEPALPVMGPTPLTCQNMGFDAMTGQSWCIDASGNRIADPSGQPEPTNATTNAASDTPGVRNRGRSSSLGNAGRSRSTTGDQPANSNATPNASNTATNINSCLNFWFDATTGKSGCLTPMDGTPAASVTPSPTAAATGKPTAAPPAPEAKTCLSQTVDAKTGQLTCLSSPNDLLEAVPSDPSTPTNALSAPKPADLSAYPTVFPVGGSMADQRYMGELINAIAKADEPVKRTFYDIAQSFPDYFVSRAKLTCEVLEAGQSLQEARKLRNDALNLGSRGQTLPAAFKTTESDLTDQLAVKHYCPQFLPKQK